MEEPELRTLTAGQTMAQYLLDNASHFVGDGALILEQGDLDDKIVEILALKAIEDANNKGIATDKVEDKLAAATKAKAIAKLVRYFANKTHNNTVKESVDFSFSDLYHVDDALAVTRWNIILTVANTNLAAMIALLIRITATDTLNLGTLISDFTSEKMAPRTAIVGRKVAALSMKSRIKELDDIAEDIISLADGYILTDEDFVNGVTFSYRKGVLGAKHILLELHYVDDVTGVTLKGVHSATTNGVTTHDGVSTRNGNIREKTLANGNYIVTSSFL